MPTWCCSDMATARSANQTARSLDAVRGESDSAWPVIHTHEATLAIKKWADTKGLPAVDI